MSIREIPAAAITDAVEALCIEANTRLPAALQQRVELFWEQYATAARETKTAAALAAAVLDIVAWTFVVEPHSQMPPSQKQMLAEPAAGLRQIIDQL